MLLVNDVPLDLESNAGVDTTVYKPITVAGHARSLEEEQTNAVLSIHSPG